MGAEMTVLSLTPICAGGRHTKDPSAVSWALLEMPKSDAKVWLSAGDCAAYWALE